MEPPEPNRWPKTLVVSGVLVFLLGATVGLNALVFTGLVVFYVGVIAFSL